MTAGYVALVVAVLNALQTIVSEIIRARQRRRFWITYNNVTRGVCSDCPLKKGHSS